MAWSASAWADCYIFNLGDGDRLHDCDDSRDSGYEIGFGGGDGVLMRQDGLVDYVFGIDEVDSVIMRSDGRIDDAYHVGYGNAFVVQDLPPIDQSIDLTYMRLEAHP